MQKQDLAHILRASAAILNEREFVVVGSQSIWGTTDRPPAECLRSMEADIYPLAAPSKADILSATIGEVSPFHEAFGYYAEGVSPTLPVLPDGWRSRMCRVEFADGCVAWCLSAPDLAISKYAAGRDKDAPFNRALARSQLVDENDLLRLAKSTPFRSSGDLERVSARIRADFRAVRREIGCRRDAG